MLVQDRDLVHQGQEVDRRGLVLPEVLGRLPIAVQLADAGEGARDHLPGDRPVASRAVVDLDVAHVVVVVKAKFIA